MRYEQSTLDSLNIIFSAIVIGAIKRDHAQLKDKLTVNKTCLHKFIGTFTNNVFFNEYAVLYEVIKRHKIHRFTLPQLREVLERERNVVLNSKYVDMSKWSMAIDNRPLSDDEKFEAFWLDLRDLVVELSNTVVSEDDYDSSCEAYKQWYIYYMSFQTIQNMAMIMSDNGLTEKRLRNGGNIKYQGVADMRKYYSEQMAVMQQLEGDDAARGTVIDEQWLTNDISESKNTDDADAILTTGFRQIDESFGTFRRTHLVTLLGPPKGGKTTFAVYLVDRALRAGLNVCVWAIEGNKKEWISKILACMIKVDNNLVVNSRDIISNKVYNDDKLGRVVTLAKTRLASDITRGKLSFIEGSAYCEDFIDIIDAHYRTSNQFDVIVVDQLVDILSRRNKGKAERISEAYVLFKDYIEHKAGQKALAIVPAQLKQTAIDSLLRNPDDVVEITAGGESAETIRSADHILALFSTREEKRARQRHIYGVATRHGDDFDDFTCGALMECSYFSEDINAGVKAQVVNME